MPQYRFVAFDFDKTVCTDNYPGVGVILPRHQIVIDFLRAAKADGSICILNTCREGESLISAIAFCKRNKIPVDYANENPLQDFPSRKLFADIYIDDRSISAYNLEDDLVLHAKHENIN